VNVIYYFIIIFAYKETKPKTQIKKIHVMNTSEPFIITISRQFGSGGRFIGQELTKRLGVDYIDNEILNKAAEEFSIDRDNLKAIDEKLPSWWENLIKVRLRGSDTYYVTSKHTEPTSEQLFEAETRIMKKLTDNHSAIVVGRCGFYVFRDHPNCLKIFLHSKLEDRIKRIQELHNIPERKALMLINENDNARANYMRKFTGHEWWDARQFDLSLDTSSFTNKDKCVDFIINYIKNS